MAKYQVYVTLECTAYKNIEVEASTEEEAGKIALTEAQKNGIAGFEINENVHGSDDYYVCEDCVEKVN
jgi:hypothetical protein